MPKIIIVGVFGEEKTVSDGQINKVRDYYRYIRTRFGDEFVKRVDIGEYKKKPLKTLLHFLEVILYRPLV